MHLLTAMELESLCRIHPGWTVTDGALVRTYAFPEFMDSIAFVNRLAVLAEASGHHPDIDVRYNKVKLTLVTHDAGGISARDADFVTALAMDAD